jgi:hypothetical protein
MVSFQMHVYSVFKDNIHEKFEVYNFWDNIVNFTNSIRHPNKESNEIYFFMTIKNYDNLILGLLSCIMINSIIDYDSSKKLHFIELCGVNRVTYYLASMLSFYTLLLIFDLLALLKSILNK